MFEENVAKETNNLKLIFLLEKGEQSTKHKFFGNPFYKFTTYFHVERDSPRNIK